MEVQNIRRIYKTAIGTIRRKVKEVFGVGLVEESSSQQVIALQ